MIFRRLALTSVLTIIAVSSTQAAGKTGARIERVTSQTPQDIRVRPSLVAADTCFASDNGVIVFRIGQWVTGQELYKSLIDPANSCANPYPYTVSEINMPMYFADTTPLTVSVDIETVDYTTVPGCPVPGIVLAISQDYNLAVPAGGGMFNIWIPLDTPMVVNEPFFAGFFIGNAVDTAAGAEVLTDSLPVPCTSFNIWDQNIGFIDLTNNQYFNFPGRLAMEVSGVPGGSGGGTLPQTVLLFPANNDTLYGQADLWCYDSAGVTAVDYALFEYSSGGPFVEIGRDFDDAEPLRDGVTAATAGSGLGWLWDFSSLPEGNYTVRATIVDTLGNSSQATATVYLEPTPPIARITTPDNGNDICAPLPVIMSTADEDLSFVTLYRKSAGLNYSAGLTPMSQFSVGDANGNPNDGNQSVNGEFGNYYSGPTAATVAIEGWKSRGVTGVMASPATREAVAEELATLFHTRANLGTYDDDLYAGLLAYSASHGGTLKLEVERDPSYFDVRRWAEEEERIVILGLSGNPGVYLTVDGFNGWVQPDSSFHVSIADPITGMLQNLSWRQNFGISELQYQATWHRVDVMISLVVANWNVPRTVVGADFSGADGWSYNLQATGLNEDSLYFLRSVGRDAKTMEGMDAVLVRINCSQTYVAGDYDNSGAADISDLFSLISFITQGGPSPVGGAARADANCDNYINVTDIVYYMNYLFGSSSPPCY